MPKMETHMVNEIDYREWDRFIKERFPNCPYEGIVAEEELRNDSTWTSYFVDKNLSTEEFEEVEDYLLRGIEKESYGSVFTVTILHYLIMTGVLESGRYNIKVSW